MARWFRPRWSQGRRRLLAHAEGGAERPGEEGGAGDASAALHCDLASLSLDDAEHALLQQTADRTRSSLVGEYGKTRWVVPKPN